MHQASVGFHCPECTRSGAQKVVKAGQLRQRPAVTYALIAVNLAVFVACIGSGLETRPQVIQDYAVLGESPIPGLPIGVASGEWYRLVTGGFLHANVIHIAFNMLALYQLGLLLEPAFGRLRFALVYLVSMLVGSLGVVLLHPDQFTVGASGAVFGLMGFAFMAMRARGIDPFSTGLGGTIVINLIITFTLSSYISVGGHVGGLIGGVICGWVVTDFGPKQLKDERATLGVVAAIGAAAFLASILLA
jgi:membrane associated rhomboid family serine protease